jgi:hypothetical protein
MGDEKITNRQADGNQSELWTERQSRRRWSPRQLSDDGEATRLTLYSAAAAVEVVPLCASLARIAHSATKFNG